MGGQQAPPEAAVPASLGLVSISDCLIGTSQSGHVSESSDRSLRGLRDALKPEEPLVWLLLP